MINSSCNIILDKTNRELNVKGTAEFPVAIYYDDLKEEPVPYHWHEEIELIVVVEGEMELVVELEKFILKPNDGIFINSGRLHSCIDFDDSNCRLKSFVLSAKFLFGEQNSVLYQRYFHKLLGETALDYEMLNDKQCSDVLKAFHIFTKEQFGFEFEIRTLISNILLPIINSNKNPCGKIDDKRIKQLNRCKKMMSFIQNNYNNDITLSDIANSGGVKESEALRCFKLVLNTSPIKYLKTYRIEQTALLLKTSTLPIIDIAFSCGFHEISYFSKSFKEMFLLTPTEYRKKHFIASS